MAIHNQVMLYGQVERDPNIMEDENHNIVRAMCPIIVIRGIRDSGNHIDHIKYSIPIIMTSNPEQAAEIATWKKNDMVEIKGTINTKDIIKKTTCPKCKHSNKKEGNIVSIHPIYLSKRESNLTEAEGLELLKKRCEISNQVTLIGTVCKDITTYRTQKGLQITEYTLAVNRKYRIAEDDPNVKTDYPHVKSYGKIAENDAKALKVNSKIFLDGMIQTRKVERTSVCEECGESYHWNDTTALEIIPYAIEYLKDCRTPEEIEAMEEEENQAIITDILKK